MQKHLARLGFTCLYNTDPVFVLKAKMIIAFAEYWWISICSSNWTAQRTPRFTQQVSKPTKKWKTSSATSPWDLGPSSENIKRGRCEGNPLSIKYKFSMQHLYRN